MFINMAVLDHNDTQKYEKVATSENHKDEVGIKETYGYGVRHIQAILIFTSLTFIYVARAHLSVTIVAMTDGPRFGNLSKINVNITNLSVTILSNTALNDSEQNKEANSYIIACSNRTFAIINDYNQTEKGELNNTGLCKEIMEYSDISDVIENEEDSSIWNVYKVYPWPKSTQEVVLGAFFLGYLIMTSPMGVVCQRWGGKLPLQISLLSSAIVTFLTPWLAVLGGYRAVAASRVIMGLSQAGTYPGIHTLVAKWVPSCERGRLGTYIYTGSMIGSVLAYHISGLLAASPLGWPSTYWVIGVLCLIIGILVTIFGAPSPQQHPSISTEEKKFIIGKFYDHVEKRQPTPWKAIFTSKPVWATLITHVGTSTTYLFFFSQVPTYLHYVVGINIKNSGLLSSLPYFANFLMSIVMANLGDHFINKKILSCRAVRIISNATASFGPAACLLSLSFIKDPTLAVICLILCMGLFAGVHTGWMVNYIDLSPNYSGTLMATGNTVMNIFALILPTLVANIVTEMTDAYQWRIVLIIISIWTLICNAVFMVFMSAEVQPWNYAKSEIRELEAMSETQEKPIFKGLNNEGLKNRTS